MGRLKNIARDVIRKAVLKNNVLSTTFIEYLYVTDKKGNYMSLEQFLEELEGRMGDE